MAQEKQVKLAAEWTDDCQGKKDYDGHILSISTRYWPAGGGFTLIHNDGSEVTFQEGIEGIRPSAHSSLVINGENEMEDVELASKQFEGDSFAEVSAQVEAWAQKKMDKAVKVLRAAFVGK